jgi:hypothetical protein
VTRYLKNKIQKKTKLRVWGVAQVTEHLPGKYEALCLIPSIWGGMSSGTLESWMERVLVISKFSSNL